MTTFWILNADHTLRPTEDVLEWARTFEDNDARRVAATQLTDDIWISTVFLGIDYGWGQGDPSRPVVFETMVFVDGESKDEERYCSWNEAVEGHSAMCKKWAPPKHFVLWQRIKRRLGG